MNELIEKMKYTPPKIFLIISLGLTAFYYFSLYNDGAQEDKQIKTLGTTIDQKQKELTEAQEVAKDEGQFQKEVNFVSNQLRAALEYLPADLEVEDIHRRLTTEVRSSGIRLISFQKSADKQTGESGAFFETLEMDIELEGSFPQVTLFLANISKIKRIVKIRDFSIATVGQSDADTIRLKGRLLAYRYVEKKAT